MAWRLLSTANFPRLSLSQKHCCVVLKIFYILLACDDLASYTTLQPVGQKTTWRRLVEPYTRRCLAMTPVLPSEFSRNVWWVLSLALWGSGWGSPRQEEGCQAPCSAGRMAQELPPLLSACYHVLPSHYRSSCAQTGESQI